jgi:hypothetical protein
MRLGVQREDYDRHGKLVMPSLHRVLYRPWLYWGTSVWDKMENRKVDRRKLRYGKPSGARRPTGQKRSA